jgi:NAD-dependent deacetylase
MACMIALEAAESSSSTAISEGLMNEAEHAAASAEVFLVIGTSAVVYPAAGLVPYARQSGAKVIEINPEATPFSAMVDCALQAPAGELLPKLL